MLSIQGLTVRFGALTAVDDVDLEIPDGNTLALLGPSGCGKSTLLRAIAGIEPPTGGSVAWDGVDLARIPVHRRRFGLMFQDGVLFPHRTVAGNVGYGLRGDPGREARIAELLELVGLAGYQDRRVATLSGGEAQRVALARALAPRPRLLLLDEPLAALDRALREQLLVDLAAVLDATGTTAVFVTHDQGEAFAIADRIALMRAGAVVQVGAPQEVWRRPRDVWAARFLGCGAVIGGRPQLDADGRWWTATAVGPVAGRASCVGLHASALVADPDGAIRANVVTCVAGPERRQLTVRLATRPGGSPTADRGDADSTDHDDAFAHTTLPAVAPPGPTLAPGAHVRLRFEAAQAALIGSRSPAAGSGDPHGSDGVPAPVVVVAGAVVRAGELLIARRTAPPELAGRWELPGGKVEPGESETAALARELAEELGIVVEVGGRLGAAIPLGCGADGVRRELHAFHVELRSGTASYSIHDALRWVAPDDLDGIDWVPADRALLPELRRLLQDERSAGARPDGTERIVPGAAP